MIGIIIPPGEIKKMVEKTAAHVAKNGSDFQKALIQMEQNKPQFAFLLKDNPYRGYYDHMVADYSRKLLAESAENKQALDNENIQKIDIKEEPENNQQAQYLEKVFEEIKEPDPDRFSAPFPEKITRVEVAMILHTAQYAAINGKNFLIALSERQKNNPQFQFLRSSSDNHQFFRKMISAYETVLAFSSEDVTRLQKYTTDKKQFLKKCQDAFEYHRLKQEQNKGKKNESDNKKQANIDWNDFQLVQTIIFDDFKSKNSKKDDFRLRPSLYTHKNMEQKIISEPKRKQLLQQCHVCKKNILASELTKHLKNCISGNNAQKNQNFVKNNQGDNVDITKNLQNMSARRPDIFGGEGEKIRIDDPLQQKNEEERLIWDGQAANITRATASAAMLNNQQKKLKQRSKNDGK